MKLQISDILFLAMIPILMVGAGGESCAQTKISRVGILTIEPPGDAHKQSYVEFYRALRTQGWVEGKDVEFTYGKTGGDSSRLAHAASELVALKVDVIFADSASALRAAFAATRSIPIVGEDLTTDPVAAGYVESYGRPRGNLQGSSSTRLSSRQSGWSC
jgi:ABC-type uncharacterized transport system substrate-binding protein